MKNNNKSEIDHKDYINIYIIINNKLNEEVKEFYTFTTVMLAINTIFISILTNDKIYSNIILRIILNITMLIISIYWIKMNSAYGNWKAEWIETAKKYENKIFKGQKKYKMWVNIIETAKIKNFGSISEIITKIIWVFILLWTIILLITLYPYIIKLAHC